MKLRRQYTDLVTVEQKYGTLYITTKYFSLLPGT